MAVSYRTPAWLSGILAILVVASVGVFAALIVVHAKKSGLEEHIVFLQAEVVQLRDQDGKLNTLVGETGPLAKQCQLRSALLKELDKETQDAYADAKILIDKSSENSRTIESELKKAQATITRLEAEIKERRQELLVFENQLITEERDNEAKRTKKRDEIMVQSKDLDTNRKKYIKENEENSRRIFELKERIAELTRQRQMANQDQKADGVIMEADSSVGFVVIDLGRHHALRKGTKFTVFNRQAGRSVIKGLIEVMNVEDSLSTCRVLEEKDPNNPLVPNDQISNPVFDRDKVKGFAIRGAFRRFSKDELKRFIVESGGRYDDELSVSTDYLVAGENASKFLEDANRLGITILSEEQLVESQLFRLPTGKH